MGDVERDEGLRIKKKILEAVLFVSSSSISLADLAKLLDSTPAEVINFIKETNEEYSLNHGLRILVNNNRVQLTTAPEVAQKVEEFLGMEITTTLSRAALESLAIIAYQQPITRPQIDEIRGVNSDGVIRNLLSKGLIQEIGRAESIGKPILYGTTEDFLHYFGLSSLAEIPDISTFAVSDQNVPPTLLKQ